MAADHVGVSFKPGLAQRLLAAGYTVLDLGTGDPAPVEYPDYAYAVATAVATGRAQRGIVLTGSCLGAAIAANKLEGIRCAPVTDPLAVEEARRHNDANMLSLCARFSGWEMIERLAVIFMLTPFEGGIHAARSVKTAFFTTAQRAKSAQDVIRGQVAYAASELPATFGEAGEVI